jgi:hypothetical protein
VETASGDFFLMFVFVHVMQFDMSLGSFGLMLFGMMMMSAGKVSVMASGLVIAILVMFGSQLVMVSGFFVMFGSLGVMLGGFLRVGHGDTPLKQVRAGMWRGINLCQVLEWAVTLAWHFRESSFPTLTLCAQNKLRRSNHGYSRPLLVG